MGKSYKRLKQEIHELKNQLDVKNNRIAVLLLAKSALEDKVAKLSEKRVFKVKFRTTDKEKVTHKAIDGTEFDTLSEVVEHNEKLPTIKEKSDSLVKKVCLNQMCQGVWCDCDNKESDSLVKKPLDIRKAFQSSFSKKQVDFVIDSFGLEEAEKVLDLCQILNINPLSLKK